MEDTFKLLFQVESTWSKLKSSLPLSQLTSKMWRTSLVSWFERSANCKNNLQKFHPEQTEGLDQGKPPSTCSRHIHPQSRLSQSNHRLSRPRGASGSWDVNQDIAERWRTRKSHYQEFLGVKFQDVDWVDQLVSHNSESSHSMRTTLKARAKQEWELMRVDSHESFRQLSSTIINSGQTRENSHQLSWKIWTRSKSTRAHESRWECIRVTCQKRVRVWTLILVWPRLKKY